MQSGYGQIAAESREVGVRGTRGAGALVPGRRQSGRRGGTANASRGRGVEPPKRRRVSKSMPRRPSYSCRQFRRQHVEFVDGLLCNEAHRACTEHVSACPACAHHDVQVRRSLLALQALPSIEPSADFRQRLRARLAQEAQHPAPAPVRPGIRWGVAGVVVAASFALLAATAPRTPMSVPVRLNPVVARAPEPTALRLRAPATAVNQTVSTARFAAVRGPSNELPLPFEARHPAVRLQLANYLRQ